MSIYQKLLQINCNLPGAICGIISRRSQDPMAFTGCDCNSDCDLGCCLPKFIDALLADNHNHIRRATARLPSALSGWADLRSQKVRQRTVKKTSLPPASIGRGILKCIKIIEMANIKMFSLFATVGQISFRCQKLV